MYAECIGSIRASITGPKTPINRRRERIMKRFKSPRQVQRFLSAHDQVANLFPRRRDYDIAANLRSGLTQA
jgi:putative transposase